MVYGPSSVLIHPVGNEDVCIALGFAVTIRGEYELFAVLRKHREAIKRLVKCYLFQARAIDINLVEIKVTPPGIIHVRSKDDAFAIREKVWRKIGFAIFRNLTFVRAVGVHYP